MAFPAFFGSGLKEKKRGALKGRRAWKIKAKPGSRSKWLHGRNQAHVRATAAALKSCHFQGAFGSRSAAILFRAIETDAGAALDFDLFGDGLVAGNLFGDGFSHATFAALGGAGGVNFFGNSVITAGFHLFRLRAIARLAGAEH